jgi:hypothetical protein
MQGGARGKIVSEIMGDITEWRKLRDGDYQALWDEYYAKWRGFWMPQHKGYKTERSKLISPLTSMAVDLTSAEIIEAVFGREYFVDMPDNVGDEDTADVEAVRNALVNDLKDVGFVKQFGLVVLNGCLYGNGIAKIQVEVRKRKKPYRKQDGQLVVETLEEVHIKPVAVEPGQFVGDPSADDIDMMKGCAHEFHGPINSLRQKQAEGVYYPDVVISEQEHPILTPNRGDTPMGNMRKKRNTAFITEYYGLIPTRLFLAATAEGNGTAIPEEMIASIPATDMTEVIATIVNESHLLRVIENPLITGERLMLAYQHESVSGRFVGRGVAEKGANLQRAMDAEMRARIDAMAWSNNPMFAGDLTRMPPGSKLAAWPGKFWGTRGNPREVIQEFKISGPDGNTYQHMQELERMGQQATGALDTASMRQGMRDETATGSALMASGMIKRSKRTMYNIEEFMTRLVTRTARLKMQYDAERYPQDYEFRVRGTMGIMAREIEQQFMVNLLQIVGGDSPAGMPIIRAIFEHSGSPVKAEVLEALRAIEQRQPTPEEQAAQKAALEAPVLENQKTQAEIAKIMAEAGHKDAQEDKTRAEQDVVGSRQTVDEIKALNDLQETDNQIRQLDILEGKNEIERAKLTLQARQGKK